MKICIPENFDKQSSGKHKFLSRLVYNFKTRGIKIVNNDADILLHIGRNAKGVRSKKIIMRIDGLILNKSMPYEKSNNKILKYINKSDAVIYQGYFCKNAYEQFLGVKKRNVIIQNGADPNDFITRKVYNYYFSFCKWRPHKRLKNICEGFIEAVNNGLDSELLIAGKPDGGIIEHPKIKYLGWISSEEIKKHLSHAIATIHLSWLDWCPNSMVESIVSGCPIIYSDSGGSLEIGKFGGIFIKDVQWDFKPTYLYKPPKLNLKEISNALFSIRDNIIVPDGRELYIDKIADKYIEFFKEVLSCRK